VTDKTTGAVYAGLNRFVDGGDRGDEYNYCAPEHDVIVDRPAARPTTTRVEDGPARATLKIEMTCRLPMALTDDRATRSTETIEMPITSYVSLASGVRRVDVRTVVENRAGDHRLRVHFPAPLVTDHSDAEDHFDVAHRPIDVPTSTQDWIEQPVPTHPQRGFVDVSDGQIGLMIANRGLPEYEVLGGNRGKSGGTIVALTLLRCVGWLSRDDFPARRGHAGPALETPEAQMLGRWEFDYAIILHSGDWQMAFQGAHAYQTPLRAVVTDQHVGTLPTESSFLHVEPGALVVSAIKWAEENDGLVVRIYNISTEPVEGRIKLGIGAGVELCQHGVVRVNLNEEETGKAEIDEQGWVKLRLRSREIATLKFMTEASYTTHALLYTPLPPLALDT